MHQNKIDIWIYSIFQIRNKCLKNYNILKKAGYVINKYLVVYQ